MNYVCTADRKRRSWVRTQFLSGLAGLIKETNKYLVTIEGLCFLSNFWLVKASYFRLCMTFSLFSPPPPASLPLPLYSLLVTVQRPSRVYVANGTGKDMPIWLSLGRSLCSSSPQTDFNSQRHDKNLDLHMTWHVCCVCLHVG